MDYLFHEMILKSIRNPLPWLLHAGASINISRRLKDLSAEA
jgi:hypothetical protein